MHRLQDGMCGAGGGRRAAGGDLQEAGVGGGLRGGKSDNVSR